MGAGISDPGKKTTNKKLKINVNGVLWEKKENKGQIQYFKRSIHILQERSRKEDMNQTIEVISVQEFMTEK
jgi:hypothetical protein